MANTWPVGVEMVPFGGAGLRCPLQKVHTREMGSPWTDPGLRELLALAVVAAFGCGLALAQEPFLRRHFCCGKRSGHRGGAATLSVR